MAYGTVNADVIGTSVAGSNLGAGNASIMKNRLINGNMVISQRNGTSSAAGDTGYSLDRWYCFWNSNGAITLQQSSTAPTGFTNSFLATVGTADTSIASGEYVELEQRIEGFNVADLGYGTANAKTVTLSFWVRSALTGTYCISLRNSANNRCYIAEYTILAANTWEQKSITIAGDTTGTWLTNNGLGLTVGFSLAIGSTFQQAAGSWGTTYYAFASSNQVNWMATVGNTFYFTGVQLEVGSSATGFEYVNYQTSLANCYRYYYQMSGVVNQDILVGTACDQTTWLRYGFALPTTMRSTPSLVSAGGTSYANLISSGGRASTSISLDNSSTTNACVNLYSAGISAGTTGTFRLQAGLYLGLSAEL